MAQRMRNKIPPFDLSLDVIFGLKPFKITLKRFPLCLGHNQSAKNEIWIPINGVMRWGRTAFVKKQNLRIESLYTSALRKVVTGFTLQI